MIKGVSETSKGDIVDFGYGRQCYDVFFIISKKVRKIKNYKKKEKIMENG